MNTRTVTTQTEFDQAIADRVAEVIIDSPRGVWLTIGDSGGSSITVTGESCIAQVTGSATVGRVDGSATVKRVDGSATVEWVDGSATVEWVTGSATVERVTGSATVERVDGSATVGWAAQTSTVHLYAGTLRKAAPHVAVFLHSTRATFEGGHVIDLTSLDMADPVTWAEHHGCDTENGRVTVYKAVRADLRSAHGVLYAIGTEVSCDDFQDTDTCGNGLHFSPSPAQAHCYDDEATRFLECSVALSELRPITESGAAKCKAPRAFVVREVDIHGRPLAASAGVTEATP